MTRCDDCGQVFETQADCDKHGEAIRPAGGPPLAAGRCKNPALFGMTVNDRGEWAMPRQEATS